MGSARGDIRLEDRSGGGHEGRLELTWTNKDRRLLTRADGAYEWIPRHDYRVAEVRLLRQAGSVGETGTDNLLINGDALDALRSLARVPEYADRYLGRVKLAYLDPPFNTQQSFLNYDDALEHSVWLTMIRDRLEQVRELLAPDGSVWLHCDDSEQAYARVMMDEIFGRENFVASLIWRSADTGNYDAKQFSGDHNTIIVFSKQTGWRSNRVERTEEQRRHYANPDDDPRGPWFDGNPVGSPNPRDNLRYDLTSPEGHIVRHPPNGWRWSRPTLERLMAQGAIRWNADGKRIIYRTYLADQAGLPPSTLWADTRETGSNRKAKNELKKLYALPASEVFDTPKPEALVEKILAVGTEADDLILDCFLGSGTTAAVAHKTGRRWIGIEPSVESVETWIIPRLKKVVAGEDGGGVTKKLGWRDGGGFQVLDIAPSMFEDDEGQIILADWATNGKLAEATAAQLGFAFEPDPPLCGRKGRSRLAVIDGHLSSAVVRLLVDALDEGERLTLCGTSLDPLAVQTLRDIRPGSRVRKIPDSLLAEYQENHRWQPRGAAPSQAPPLGGPRESGRVGHPPA